MALTIADNSLANNSNLYISNIFSRLTRSVQKITSGLRLFDASEDPAASAVAGMMRAQIAGYSQGERNLEDAISLIQTAQSSLEEIDTNLELMKELAEQSATGTYTDEQRLIMQSEFSSLGAEIDRISNSTQFNGIKLLDGTLSSSKTRSTPSGWSEANGGLRVHFGINNNRNEDYYYISVPKTNTSYFFGSSLPSISSSSSADSAIDSVTTALLRKENALSYLGGMQNRLEASLDHISGMKNNLEETESSISNVDLADEVTNYIELSVLLESAATMLGQANILPQKALALLNFS